MTTADDYILTTFHITGTQEGGKFEPTKESILVQHGYESDAAAWINDYHSKPQLQHPPYEEEKPMALQLADLGYDIWFGNNRGTEYSQKHRTLSAKDDPSYWSFSWSEMGLYDAPANIDLIKEQAATDKIFYVGYSQGTVQMFYALSHIEESYL